MQKDNVVTPAPRKSSKRKAALAAIEGIERGSENPSPKTEEEVFEISRKSRKLAKTENLSQQDMHRLLHSRGSELATAELKVNN